MTSRESSVNSTRSSTGQVQRDLVLEHAGAGAAHVLRVLAGVVGVVVEVVEVPAPLLADDLDVDVRVGGGVLDRGGVAVRVVEEHPDHDDRQDHVHDLERHVVPQLHGEGVVTLALPVDRDAPQDQAPGDDADDERGDPRADPQAGDAAGLVGDLVLGAAGEPAALHLGGASAHGDGDDGKQTGQQQGWSPRATGGVRVQRGDLSLASRRLPRNAAGRHPGPSSSTCAA